MQPNLNFLSLIVNGNLNFYSDGMRRRVGSVLHGVLLTLCHLGQVPELPRPQLPPEDQTKNPEGLYSSAILVSLIQLVKHLPVTAQAAVYTHVFAPNHNLITGHRGHRAS